MLSFFLSYFLFQLPSGRGSNDGTPSTAATVAAYVAARQGEDGAKAAAAAAAAPVDLVDLTDDGPRSSPRPPKRPADADGGKLVVL